jgi:predicted N-acyltransferase
LPGLDLRVLDSVADVPASDWDALFAHEPARATPFVRHAWLRALEDSGAAAPRTGWTSRHLTLWRAGRLVAAAPAWAKEGSDGDFSRDWHWADAAARAGIPYYPKLVLGVPFTPATGRRILVAAGEERAPLVALVVRRALDLCAGERLRSVHALFPAEDEARELEAAGLALRLDFQYHWRNAGYRTFDDFLARFPSKRRNAIRRERAALLQQGIAVRTVRGEELRRGISAWARQVAALHGATVDRMTFGRRWVGRGFYERVLAAMPEAIEVVEARREGRLIAMAFNVAGSERLYGRYWGCSEDHPFLHFNVCLYHSIDECIRQGTQVFEGGAGGDHKLARGFDPAETWSAHAFLDARLDVPVRRALEEELEERRQAVARWRNQR